MEWNRVEWAVGLATATAAAIWASAGLVLQALLLLMALDVASGLVAAWGEKALDSDVGWRKLKKKFLMLAVVAAAAIVQPIVSSSTQVNLPLTELTAGFLCANEALSIVENAARAGVPVPAILREALAKLRQAGDGEQRLEPHG